MQGKVTKTCDLGIFLIQEMVVLGHFRYVHFVQVSLFGLPKEAHKLSYSILGERSFSGDISTRENAEDL
jgi:hypothetical protein